MPVKRNDFTVDLAKREVRHVSGVIVQFCEYPTREAWLATDSVEIRNRDLFDGDTAELAEGAKHAAVAAGMTHQKP
ncbi:MAG: hypothetical protein ACLQFI_19815 [Methylocella sp.]|jgi:hypothetical protein